MTNNKDWTGNSKSTFSTLGASNHSDYERAKHDYYATDPKVIRPLIEKLKEYNDDLHKNIWENACGENHLVNELRKFGCNVLATDKYSRGAEDRVVDFLKTKDHAFYNGDILTNPPYKYATEWVYKSLEKIREGRKLLLFLKLTFLEGQKRRLLFDKYPPKYVFVFSKRVQVARNGDEEMFKKSSAAAYAWFVWEKGYYKKPIIDWI